jgi:hypothetical protein
LKRPLSLKVSRAKWTRGVTQAVEHLLCKWEALSSNPVPLKKKKEKNHLTQVFFFFNILFSDWEEILKETFLGLWLWKWSIQHLPYIILCKLWRRQVSVLHCSFLISKFDINWDHLGWLPKDAISHYLPTTIWGAIKITFVFFIRVHHSKFQKQTIRNWVFVIQILCMRLSNSFLYSLVDFHEMRDLYSDERLFSYLNCFYSLLFLSLYIFKTNVSHSGNS